ncbi:MAG TPA: RND transporter [Pirellulales bacterium]|jgi:hypothetical protein|nr:RND transporter [Pirellulales bacterium]
MSYKNTFTLGSVLIVSFALPGCGRSPQGGAVPAAAHAQTAGEAGHGGWWCDEHGVPESICALCDSKLAAKFKAKGDWCSDHDRPDSQCFECHPELEAKFAAQYEAKYGKQPPKP